MPSINFAGCISNYWFVWSINGLGSVFSLAINMAISFFFLKYFHNIPSGSPSTPKKPKTDFSNVRTTSPVMDISGGSWSNETMVGNASSTSSV